MRIHLNAGNDIETPAQMGDAILFCGVPTVNVVFYECVELSCEPSAKLEGISQIQNVQLEDVSTRPWKANSEAKLSIPSISQLLAITGVTWSNSCSFAPVK